MCAHLLCLPRSGRTGGTVARYSVLAGVHFGCVLKIWQLHTCWHFVRCSYTPLEGFVPFGQEGVVPFGQEGFAPLGQQGVVPIGQERFVPYGQDFQALVGWVPKYTSCPE